MNMENKEEFLLLIGFDDRSITVYSYICYLLNKSETAELHYLAFSLMFHCFKYMEGGYETALYHANKAYELDPHPEYKSLLLMFYEIPEQIISVEIAIKTVNELLDENPNFEEALRFKAEHKELFKNEIGCQYYSFGYDKNGNETSVVYVKEGNRSKTRTYDASNRLTTLSDRGGSQQWVYPTESDKLKSFLFTYGSFSQTNSYEYNKLDQNTVVKDGAHTYRFDYDERGNVRTFTSGNGAGSTFNYTDSGLVESLVAGTANGTELLSEKYRYDKNGNRTKIDYPDGTSVSYEYGDLDQLTKETLKDGTIQEYSYDGFGNRKIVQVTKEGQTTTTNAQYNIANQLTQFGNESITYDLNGNRLSDGKYKYEWNAADQLVSVTKQGESTPFVTYQYNEDGKRIQKNVNGTVTNYHYDGDSLNVLYETDGQNNVVRSYTYSEEGQLLSMKKGDKKFFYHYNAHGDVIALTDVNGQKVASYEYDSWGNVLKAEEAEQIKDNPYRYAGYQFDRETGMYYLIARYYQPEQGVFLSLDPDAGDEDNILTQNGYAYSNNNPVNFVDPDGELAWAIAFAAYDGYSAYKKGKKRGYKGWKQARYVAWNSAFGRFGKIGKVLKFAKKIDKRANLKKQGREIREKKREGSGFKSRSNKDPNRPMKKHTPSKSHQKKKRK